MTGKPDGKRNSSAREIVEVEHDGLIFRIHAPPIFANRQCTGKFASIVSKGKAESPFAEALIDGHLAHFDTIEEAIAAGRSLLSAKLSEKPSLWRLIANVPAAILGLCLHLIVGLIVLSLAVVQAFKRWFRWAA